MRIRTEGADAHAGPLHRFAQAQADNSRNGVLGAGVFFGDDFDFYEGFAGEAGYGYGGAGGGYDSVGGEDGGVDFVHRGEVFHVLEEDGGFDDVDHAEAGGFEDGGEVLEDLGGLLLDAAGDELAGGGVEGDLAGGVEGVADADGLGVGADGGGGFFGGDCGLVLHVGIVS